MAKQYFFFLILMSFVISCKNQNNTGTSTPAVVSSDQEFPTENDGIQKLSKAEMIVASIAKANGFFIWKDVSEIQFTFNVDKESNHFERSWVWKPTKDEVSMIYQKDTVVYNRTKMDSTATKTDQDFINDSFWLLAPFHVMRDQEISFSNSNNVAAPISKQKLGKLTALYESKGGYTPGDAYDFFYDEDFIIREWVYRKGNTPEPSLETTWEDYEDFDGIRISKMHKNEDDTFKLYFTNIKVIKNGVSRL